MQYTITTEWYSGCSDRTEPIVMTVVHNMTLSETTMIVPACRQQRLMFVPEAHVCKRCKPSILPVL